MCSCPCISPFLLITSHFLFHGSWRVICTCLDSKELLSLFIKHLHLPYIYLYKLWVMETQHDGQQGNCYIAVSQSASIRADCSWNTRSKLPLNTSNKYINVSRHLGKQNISNLEQLGDNSPAILNKSSPNHKKSSTSCWGQVLKHLTRRLKLSKVHCVRGARGRTMPREVDCCMYFPAMLWWRSLFTSLSICLAL